MPSNCFIDLIFYKIDDFSIMRSTIGILAFILATALPGFSQEPPCKCKAVGIGSTGTKYLCTDKNGYQFYQEGSNHCMRSGNKRL